MLLRITHRVRGIINIQPKLNIYAIKRINILPFPKNITV